MFVPCAGNVLRRTQADDVKAHKPVATKLYQDSEHNSSHQAQVVIVLASADMHLCKASIGTGPKHIQLLNGEFCDSRSYCYPHICLDFP